METDYESICAMFVLDDAAANPLPANSIVMRGNPGKLANQRASLTGLPSLEETMFEVEGVKTWPV